MKTLKNVDKGQMFVDENGETSIVTNYENHGNMVATLRFVDIRSQQYPTVYWVDGDTIVNA